MIRLIREVTRAGRCGPRNGQYALQKALHARGPAWLKIGGVLRPGEIPWFWSWQDKEVAAACAMAGEPFVVGPNVLFADSRRPCRTPAERAVCRGASCRLMFTESAWYRDLIEQHRGPQNRAPIAVWPYPIDPEPGGPLPAEYDLLIYAKSGYRRELIRRLQQHYCRVRLLVYGRFQREELFDAARRSRCCLYLSDDDRGPLALAEILLSGCPTVGLPTGAPFVQHDRTGMVLERFCLVRCIDAVSRCHRLDRQAVATAAAEQFDVRKTVETIVEALRAAWTGSNGKR